MTSSITQVPQRRPLQDAASRPRGRTTRVQEMDGGTDAGAPAEASTVCIPGSAPIALSNARGIALRVETGSVWITHEHCADDICLDAGACYFIGRDGVTAVSATKGLPAVVTLELAVRARPTLLERCRNVWRGLIPSRRLPA